MRTATMLLLASTATAHALGVPCTAGSRDGGWYATVDTNRGATHTFVPFASEAACRAAEAHPEGVGPRVTVACHPSPVHCLVPRRGAIVRLPPALR